MIRNAIVLPALLTCLAAAGCLSVGRNFNSADLSWITPGVTTRQHIQERLGEPFRVGVDSNKPTWTYGYYTYRLIGETATKDLVVYFTMDGTVASYTFSTSFPDEKQLWSSPGRP
jgi:hypothetical protein